MRASDFDASEWLSQKVPEDVFSKILIEEDLLSSLPSSMKHNLASTIDIILGSALLRNTHIRESLGLSADPPSAGSADAVHETKSLGLPLHYAGTKKRSRFEFSTHIPGELTPHKLRNYQFEVVEKAEACFESGRPCLVSMPTGAGKTRTAVEVLWRQVRIQRKAQILIWTAPTQVLCEQAAEAIVNRFSSEKHHGLTVIRCWGSGAKEMMAESVREHVADGMNSLVCVGTPQSIEKLILESPIFQQAIDLHSGIELLVVDEAHGAVAPTIQKVIDLCFPRGPRKVLGLTATPFRTKASESAKLNSLFEDQLVFPAEALGVTSQHEMYEALREVGVLSELVLVRKHPANYVTHFDVIDWVEKMNLASKSRVLIFCDSISTARASALGLQARGIPSKAVWGELSFAEQEAALQSFRAGETKCLLNSDLLREGVDLPMVTDLFLAAPTKSLVAFRQMVGRGVRGPKSGGTKKCKLYLLGQYPFDETLSV